MMYAGTSVGCGRTLIENVFRGILAQLLDLGENIVLILNTVKEMTQPEIMQLLQNTATVMKEDEIPENVSMMYLIRQINDPAVRRGLARTMNILKTVSDN